MSRNSAVVGSDVRAVHLLRTRGPACGIPYHALVAVDAHGDDRLDWVTCRACKLLAPRCCAIPQVVAV